MKIVPMITILVACMAGQSVAAGETVHLTNGEWAPYFSEQLPHYGIGSRIVTEAFSLEGITVEYTFFPWKRGLINAQNGKYDGAVGWQMNPDRQKYFYASDTVWEAPWVFFHLKTLPFAWKTFKDLKGYRIGGTLEYMYTEEFLEAERAGVITVERVAKDELNFRKLITGRIDLFPQLLDVGYYQIKTLFGPETAQRITHDPRPLGTHAEQLLLGKRNDRNKHLMEIFNRGLRRLKESGVYEQYFAELRERALSR